MSTNPVQSSDPVLANLSGVRPDLEEATGVPCASKVEATDEQHGAGDARVRHRVTAVVRARRQRR
jgi:hypothetical protein